MNVLTCCLAASMALAPFPNTSAQAPPATIAAFGAVVNGLQLRITPISSGSTLPAHVQFEVALQNTGDSDFVLNLGTMLANGKVMWPDAIRLMLTDPAGQSRELRFSSRNAGIAGRIDDYIVALRAGSVYTVRVSLEDYTRNIDTKLTEGRYKIAAQFVGRRATGVNLDMQGVALLNLWTGVVHSNVAEFEVPTPVLAAAGTCEREGAKLAGRKPLRVAGKVSTPKKASVARTAVVHRRHGGRNDRVQRRVCLEPCPLTTSVGTITAPCCPPFDAAGPPAVFFS